MSSIRMVWVGVLLVGALAAISQAADWANYRGPDHNGISKEKDFRTNWSEAAPKGLWESKIGSGFSAFACVKDRVYTCGSKDKKQVLLCLEAATGKPVWEVPFEAEYKDGQGGNGTRSTPTVHDGKVYIIGGAGTLLCVDAEKGQEIWKKKLAAKPNWGYSGSVLIEGDMAIFPAGGEDGTFSAVDKKTGKPIWKCGSEAPSYGTAFAFTHKDHRYIFCYASKAALIADAKTGKQVGRIPWETDWDVNASQPEYADGHLFLTTGYNTGCALYKIGGTPEQLTFDEVWRSKVLMNKFTSCVLKDGILYAGDQKGLHCVEFMTGKERWKDDGLDNASVLLAGEHLIIQTEKGDVLLAKAVPDEFKILGKLSPMKGRSWTVPTLSNGRLYVRNLEKAACIDLKAQ